MATPNAEQIKAIEHKGGVLLKAGAGSGKTFVLKEHVIYLTREWINEYKGNPLEDFSQFIKSKYRKVVLMTFTKKAAGELEIRLYNEFKSLYEKSVESGEDTKLWGTILDSINYLSVGTIHSFCFKLIKQGHFPNISASQDILTEAEFKGQIEEYLHEWIAENYSEENIVTELLLRDFSNVLGAMQDIFMDPTLRLAWKNTEASTLSEEDLESVTTELIDIFGLEIFFNQKINLNDYSEFEKKTWYIFISEFLNKYSSPKPNYSELVNLFTYFNHLDFKMPNKPSIKTVPEEMVTFYENVKNMKDFLKKQGEHLHSFHESYDGFVVPWFEKLKSLFDFIDERYLLSEGVTFADLEYLVHQGVSNPKTANAIAEQFSYFIVDEFQDTSNIQFSIIEKLIQGDFNRLFSVGDLKQAIYGFRGGELQVFLDCEKKIPKSLSLLNNYRSTQNVINYNNLFFEELFTKGVSFKGIDNHTVPVEKQNIPATQDKMGEVIQLNTKLDFLKMEGKISNQEIDYIEALVLSNKIIKNHHQDEASCILYKRLKPSLIMIDLLIRKNIGFTAQIKVPYLEDPLMGIFNTLLESKYNANATKDDYLLYTIQAYLSLLSGATAHRVSLKEIEQFKVSSRYYGLYQAFLDLLNLFKVKNSNYTNNFSNIDTLIKDSNEDYEVLFKSIKKQRKMSYSLDFQYGDNTSLITIMTVHASKGLQFQHVFLGGIYTNENSILFTSLVGKYPLSFKWSRTIHDKKKFKTPYYIVEDHIRKQKDFSESKRLFYVANTRAEESLSYVNIDFGDIKRVKSQSGAWINGIQSLDSGASDKYLSIEEVDIAKSYNLAHLKNLEFAKPLFHIDNLGLETTPKSDDLYYLPELSVTRLAMIADCPRKFYLKNIIKLDDDDLKFIGPNEQSFEDIIEDDQNTELSSKSFSSAGRGSFIHETLSEIILSNFENTVDIDNKKDQVIINQAVDKLKVYRDNFDFISEQMIKFELLNYMISGIPDLILKPKTDKNDLEVWDFKTGKYSEEKLAPYYFQLYCYAYACFKLGLAKPSSQIKTVVYFVDEDKVVDQFLSLPIVEKYLSNELQKCKTPDQLNLDHCEYCQYNNICQK